MRWALIGLGVASVIAAAFAVGFFLGAEVETLRDSSRLVRAQARVALGLEKNWHKVPNGERAKTLEPRPCPSPDNTVLLVVGGQSNAANSVPTRYTASDAVSVWFDGKCYPAADPLLGADDKYGSIWSRLGEEVASITDRPVVLVVGAIGATQFSDWTDARSGYYAPFKQRIESALRYGFRPAAILWHQGETDAGVQRDMNVLSNDIARLQQQILSDVPDAKLYWFQATRCKDKYRLNGVPKVLDVYHSVAKKNARVELGMNTDVLGKEYRWDECHFNAQGREMIVAKVAPEIVKLFP